jgi:hypothetical protein
MSDSGDFSVAGHSELSRHPDLHEQRDQQEHIWAYRLFCVPYFLFPIPYSLFPIPCSLFPIPYSLFPVPCPRQRPISDRPSSELWQVYTRPLIAGNRWPRKVRRLLRPSGTTSE